MCLVGEGGGILCILKPKSPESQAFCPILPASLPLGPFAKSPLGGRVWGSQWPAVRVLL